MFCEKCHSLLKPVRRGRKVVFACQKCEGTKVAVPEKDVGMGARNLFPFENLRPVQKDFLNEARAAVSAGKFLMANAPTGMGKTAVALTASVEYGLEHGCIVFFMTSRQSQHKIAIDTLARMRKKEPKMVVADMIGKRSMCIAENIKNSRFFEEICSASLRTHSCKFARTSSEIVRKAREFPMDVDEIIKHGIARKSCPYLCAAEVGKDATVIVCDYNYLFSDISEIVLQKLGISVENIVVVIDEAHNLPERIRANYTRILRAEDFGEAAKEVAKVEPAIAGLLREIHHILSEKKFDGETKLEREFFEEIFEKACRTRLARISFSEFLEKIELLNAFLEKQGVVEPYLENIVDFIRRWNAEEKGMLRFAGPQGFVCEMLDTSRIGARVFTHSPAGIVMSATLYPLEMYRELLGVPGERAVLRYFPSPFPPENRLLVSLPKLTSRYDARSEEMYREYGRTIARVGNSVPGNTAVFYTSYQMMADICRHVEASCAKLHLYESSEMTKAEKISMLKALEEHRKDGAVLHAVLGGSLSEGIDFRDNLLSAVIIAGIPIPPPSLETLSLEQFLKEKYGEEKGYAYARLCPAFNKVLQAAGRCIRSEKDRGIIFLLDTRFSLSRYRKYLPEDFRANVIRDIEEVAGKFFRRR
ncbi:MAG: ATP-dependent DNA helicase [Thermoplasmata archaeon]|nr:ATP-dependent DNA helicase [Thermoplasmata archaeon]